ncbi:MAG: hypothetical protein D6732_11205 [Methanobacteriota archaeon]|nr:MAG: hypothetical protein D6732_11205 [Euryarchaeota archaeon]
MLLVVATNLLFSLDGLVSSQMERLFKLLKKNDTQITYHRLQEKDYPHMKQLVSIQGTFSKEFVTEFSRVIPQVVEIDFDVSNFPQIHETILRYATFVWELEKKVFLGVTALPVEFVKKLVLVTENLDFLKLLLLTPMGSALKGFLVTKPKGAVALHNQTLQVFLPAQRPDFVHHWLDKLKETSETSVEWLSGISGELPEDLQQNTGLPSNLEENLSRWIYLARKNNIEDFNFSYREAIEILGGRK